ncbi:hypothetical protein [Kushneria aurantia]|uniref:Uncharacterized protein n=1 Tax=Kushneria aurantia TaxID=504092 RepID=A0ABV6G5I0_9GAMM|nr:hypothetical protein [Kushneria aurantia]
MTRLPGLLLFAMLLLGVAALLLGAPLWPSALLGWLATLGLFGRLPRASRRQAGTLFAVGALLWALALLRGTDSALHDALVVNQPLLIMFAGVSFLSMAAPVAGRDDARDGSLIGTLLGAHLFGAAINLSVVFVFGERMQRDGRLERAQTLILGRGFTAAATWSPFFVAMGVALTYVPGLDYLTLLPWGVLTALCLLLLNYVDVIRRPHTPFHGYPIERGALLLPGLLAVAVIVIHALWPGLSIVTIIALVSPLFALLLVPNGQRRERARRQLRDGLPGLTPQFALFLAAGVLSTGLTALTATLSTGALPLVGFGALSAWLTLGVLVLLSFIGVHPLIGIATLAPLIAPLQPDATLLALMFLMSWALGTGSSPLSGSNLAISQRYAVRSRDLLRWNLPYALLGWLTCGAVLGLYALTG